MIYGHTPSDSPGGEVRDYIARCFIQLPDGSMGWWSAAVKCNGTFRDAARVLAEQHAGSIDYLYVDSLSRPYCVLSQGDAKDGKKKKAKD